MDALCVKCCNGSLPQQLLTARFSRLSYRIGLNDFRKVETCLALQDAILSPDP